MEEGVAVGNELDGASVGRWEGERVGSADTGVGSSVVGSKVGLGVGMAEGIELGDRVGIIVGAGVVGDGVTTFVGVRVGDGVGTHVEQSNVRIAMPRDGNSLLLA